MFLVLLSFVRHNITDLCPTFWVHFIIARHHDTDHPHLHLILNRVDSDGKRISDQNERIHSTQVCKELTIKHSLYFASGKENVKRHRLREPDKAKYEIYDALKSAVPRANSWQ